MNKTRNAGYEKNSGKKVTTTPAARGDSGVYNQHPSPHLGKYPASKGPGDIDEKFAETGIGDANSQTNQLRQARGVRREGKAPLATTSNAMTSKNNVRNSGYKRY